MILRLRTMGFLLYWRCRNEFCLLSLEPTIIYRNFQENSVLVAACSSGT